MERQRAAEFVEKYLETDHLIRHSYAVEAVMRALSKKLDPENEELWAISGLLHDIDADIVDYRNNPKLHGPKAVELLKEEGFGNEELYHAICAHNMGSGVPIESNLDQAIYAADPITGFITAVTLVYPDKKIASVNPKSIVKRMKDKRFAAGADRNAMKSIEKLGIPFAEFAELSLEAMREIADQLEL